MEGTKDEGSQRAALAQLTGPAHHDPCSCIIQSRVGVGAISLSQRYRALRPFADEEDPGPCESIQACTGSRISDRTIPQSLR